MPQYSQQDPLSLSNNRFTPEMDDLAHGSNPKSLFEAVGDRFRSFTPAEVALRGLAIIATVGSIALGGQVALNAVGQTKKVISEQLSHAEEVAGALIGTGDSQNPQFNQAVPPSGFTLPSGSTVRER